MNGDFAITAHRQDGAVFLCPSGELDLGAAGTFLKALNKVEDSDLRLIVLDLRGLTFMDSTGIHMIVTADKMFSQGNDHRRLAIVAGERSVMRVLEVAGLIDKYEIWQADSSTRENGGSRNWLAWNGLRTSRPEISSQAAQLSAYRRRAYR